MKKYQTPEIELLKLVADEAIAASEISGDDNPFVDEDGDLEIDLG